MHMPSWSLWLPNTPRNVLLPRRRLLSADGRSALFPEDERAMGHTSSPFVWGRGWGELGTSQFVGGCDDLVALAGRMAAVGVEDSISDRVLGTREAFFKRVMGGQGSAEQQLMKQSVAKYMQRTGLPEVGAAQQEITFTTLDGASGKLSDRTRPGRPLVLNFGSCS